MANVLNNGKETANISSGATGLVPASHPGGHSCSSRNQQHLPEGGGSGSVAAGWVGTANRFKTGHRGDHRLWRGVEPPATGDLDPGESAKPAIEVTTGFGVELRSPRSENPGRNPSASACEPFQEASKLGSQLNLVRDLQGTSARREPALCGWCL